MSRRGLLIIAGKCFDSTLTVEYEDIIGLGLSAGPFHTGRAKRHPGDSQTGNIRLFFQQTINFFYGHMPFNNVAIYDGGVAGLEIIRNVVLAFHRR